MFKDYDGALSSDELKRILTQADSAPSLLPELDEAREDIGALRKTLNTRMVVEAAEELLAEAEQIPQTTYTLYREFQRTGGRRGYERPYFLKRDRLWAAVIVVFLGDESLIDVVHDYTWHICEESNWVAPAHEQLEVDLMAVGTALGLAEMLVLIGDRMADEVVQRVRDEIERRIFVPYLERHEDFWWFHGSSNWNGVCNGGIGAAFLWLEEDEERLAQALAFVSEGLEVFLDTAFEKDGASTEGIGYWQYGLSNVIPFSEMLRQRTGGEIDLLASDRMRDIAAYPLHVALSPGRYANFADCRPTVRLFPGNLTRLAERTGVSGLRDLMAPPAPLRDGVERLPMILRNLLWWDGSRPEQLAVSDSCLPEGEVVRLVGHSSDGAVVALAAKAGHNAENHNHNDVGSFIVHAGGEDLLCDPGPGLYSRQYFSEARYENVFANSYGHSVPRIGGRLQSAGPEFEGKLVDFSPEKKRVVIEFGDAYPVEELRNAKRELHMVAEEEEAGTIRLQDSFEFSGQPVEVEEAFVTWLDVEIAGAAATLYGEEYMARLTIEEPAGATFVLTELEEESCANAKEEILKRLSFPLEQALQVQGQVRIEIHTTTSP